MAVSTYKKGFTLIELMTVISIIGFLSSTVMSFTGQARNKARDASEMASLKQFEQAIMMYDIDNNNYPIVDPVNQNGFAATNDFINEMIETGYLPSNTTADYIILYVHKCGGAVVCSPAGQINNQTVLSACPGQTNVAMIFQLATGLSTKYPQWGQYNIYCIQ